MSRQQKSALPDYIDALTGALDPRCARMMHTPAGIPNTRYDGTGRPLIIYVQDYVDDAGVHRQAMVGFEQPLVRVSPHWRPPAAMPFTRYWLPRSGELHVYDHWHPTLKAHYLASHPEHVAYPPDHNPRLELWDDGRNTGCMPQKIATGREGEYDRWILLKYNPFAKKVGEQLRDPSRPWVPLFTEEAATEAAA